MLAHSEIRLGKTQVWNRAGVGLPGVNSLTKRTRVVKPDANVWGGDASLPFKHQGVKKLGVPVGQPEYVRHFLSSKSAEHETLFERIPQVADTLAAWFLLLKCASPKANFWLRSVNPDLTDGYAGHHDAKVWQCYQRNIGSSGGLERAKNTSWHPFLFGGLVSPVQ